MHCSPGIVATCTRDIFYSGIRVGGFPLVKRLFEKEGGGDVGIIRKFGAGIVTGSIGSAIANPMDVVKIRVHVSARIVFFTIYSSLSLSLSLTIR